MLTFRPSPDASEVAVRAAIASLADPFLCVRTHALVTLREHVLNKSSSALQQIPRLLELFQSQLTSEDEYAS
jgi:hypothetical protein